MTKCMHIVQYRTGDDIKTPLQHLGVELFIGASTFIYTGLISTMSLMQHQIVYFKQKDIVMEAKVFATGYWGQDAEVIQFSDDNTVIKFSLTTNLFYSHSNDKSQRKTT